MSAPLDLIDSCPQPCKGMMIFSRNNEYLGLDRDVYQYGEQFYKISYWWTDNYPPHKGIAHWDVNCTGTQRFIRTFSNLLTLKNQTLVPFIKRYGCLFHTSSIQRFQTIIRN